MQNDRIGVAKMSGRTAQVYDVSWKAIWYRDNESIENDVTK